MARFRTKVDLWLGAVVWISLVLTVGLSIASLDLRVIAMVVPPVLLVALLAWPCDYTFEQDELVVRSGVIKWRIPYSRIYRVKPTRNPLSSPAWSLDRLAIYYGKKQVMVSPAEKNKFIAELMRRTGLRQEGEELVMPD